MKFEYEKENGICDECGEEALLTVIWSDEKLCPECLAKDYYRCDECGIYSMHKYKVVLPSGRVVCSDCAETCDPNEIPERGTCTLCGKENEKLTELDDGESVCSDCLLYKYYVCDECGERYRHSRFFATMLKDGRVLCPDCIAKVGGDLPDDEEREDTDDDDLDLDIDISVDDIDFDDINLDDDDDIDYDDLDIDLDLDDDEEKTTEDDEEVDPEVRIDELLSDIAYDSYYRNKVFAADGIYFIIEDGEILEIYDDVSDADEDGWLPRFVTGPSEEANEFLERMVSRYGIDEFFFHEMIAECERFDDDDALAYFEENNPDDAEIFLGIKEKIEDGESPFSDMEEFARALITYGLDPDRVYYCYDGAYIDLYENVSVAGDGRGECDDLSDEDWVDILENIGDYIFEP